MTKYDGQTRAVDLTLSAANHAKKRGDTWTAVWTVGFEALEGGKLRQVYKTKGGFRTKTEALQYAANPNGNSDGKAPNLHYYWKTWSENGLSKLGSSKQIAYKIAKEKVENLFFVPVDQLTIQQMQEAVNKKAPTFYPAKDIKTVLTTLLNFAVAEQWIQTNLAEFISLPELQEKELEPFTEIELHRLWDDYGKGDVFIGFILLMIYSGMMPGELFLFKKDMRMARKTATKIHLPEEIPNKAFRIGLISAIGPAMGVFIVMVGLMAAIGGPMSWTRLSIIGAAPTELTAATYGAQASGVELGGAGYTLTAMAASWFAMALRTLLRLTAIPRCVSARRIRPTP